MNDARARPSILDDVAVRAARDGARLQGDGGGQDPGPPPRGGVLQRHHGQERGIRGERSRRGGQAGASAGVLQPRQVRAPAIRARDATLRRDRPPRGDARATPRGSRRAPAGPNPPPFCHPGPTSQSRTAHTPTPHPTIDRLPGMVEAAQGEMKVVQQKWANRMELPMTEVRPPAAPRPPTPARNRPHPLPPTPRAWNGAVARRFPNRNFAARRFALATEATD